VSSEGPVVQLRFPADNDGVFSALESVFEGYDQVYVVNISTRPLYGEVAVQIGEGDLQLIEGTGNLAPGQIWTMAVPAGTPVTVYPQSGGSEGNAEGVVEGTAEGTVEGVVEGTPEGVAEGSLEGGAEGTPEGAAEGVLEGSFEGTLEGTTEGVFEGGVEGVVEGSVEGQNEGTVEGTTEGTLEGSTEGAPAPTHLSADTNGDDRISLSELLRVIQLYNSGAYHCDGGTEDGYAPGPGSTSCAPHSSDYNPQDWRIGLSELLRLIQFYNSGCYHACPGSEDGFCAGC